ncbi:hypothetical protein GQF61_05190 [Sphingobacterium sp. DK4209]|uniref:TolC family protein n=1 Tax=Sphingobacterium zhuxiongii TaxID=2662364 RepID=A0A5Q0QAP7_9SPHI|nr:MULTISPECIES: TolC family protein [unclassified Sphingobacterium]MVZ65239.1 hypothetical protein [Sphingobacterium sp. DK4209]QGA26334.1 hypothetical protein GFH32_08335 [Sphingobacterium sp. dk4302]
MVRFIVMLYFFICALLESFPSFAQEQWSLQQCMDYAVERNGSVALSRLDVDSKAIDIQMAKSERLPNLNGFSNISSNFGQSQDIFGNNARNDNFSSTLGVGSSLSLLNFGRIKNNISKSESLAKASKEDLELLKRNTRIQVAQSFLQVLLQQEIARLVDSSAMFSALQMQKIQKSTDLGVSPMSVLYEAKANHSRDVQKQASALQEIEKAMLALRHAMNLEDDRQIAIDTSLYLLKQLSLSPQEESQLSSHLWDEHPLIRKYQFLNDAMLADAKSIRANLYPSVDLSVNVGSFYFNNLTTGMGKLPFVNQLQNNFSQQVTLALNIPIYNRNAVKHNLQKNSNQILQNAEQLALNQQQFKQEMQSYLLNYRNFEKQLNLSNEALANTRLAFAISQKSFDAGKISIYDLNSSRANLLNAESEMIQVRYNLVFSKLLLMMMAKGDLTH